MTRINSSLMIQVCFVGDLHFLWTNLNDWTGLPYFCEVSHEQLNKPVVGNPTSLRIDSG